jgi:hypothetical protein
MYDQDIAFLKLDTGVLATSLQHIKSDFRGIERVKRREIVFSKVGRYVKQVGSRCDRVIGEI